METVISNPLLTSNDDDDGTYYPDTDVFYGYDIAPHVLLEFFSDSDTTGEMTEKIDFLERYGTQEYYTYNLKHKILSGFVRTQEHDQILEEIPEMNGWKSPRLGITFDMSSGKLVLRKPNGEPFLSYEELEQKANAQEQRANALATKLRELGINPDELT
jgi:hypothetical protein